MMNNTKITDFKITNIKNTNIKNTNINIPVLTLPDVNCNILGTHYAFFLGDKVWCKK